MKVVLFIVGGIFIVLAVIKAVSEWELKWKTFGLGLVIVGSSLVNWAVNSSWQIKLGAGFLLIGIICFVIGIITGIIGFFSGSSGGSSSSSNSTGGSSIVTSMNAWAESRKNAPHTCSNCLEYSATYGKCKSGYKPDSPEGRCSNWN